MQYRRVVFLVSSPTQARALHQHILNGDVTPLYIFDWSSGQYILGKIRATYTHIPPNSDVIADVVERKMSHLAIRYRHIPEGDNLDDHPHPVRVWNMGSV